MSSVIALCVLFLGWALTDRTANIVLASPPPPPPIATGDVFVAVSNGQVQWRTSAGVPIQTLNTGLGGFTTGMAFDASGNLYVTNFSVGSVSKFDPNGMLLGTFGSGYSGSPESILFDAAGNAYVGAVNGDNDIRKFSAAGAPLAQFDVAVGPRGSDWIDLAADQCTMFYTSEGTVVKRYNVCTNTQLPDFATGLHGAAFALRLLPGGGLLVADQVDIHRLDAAGNIVQTYDVAGENSWFALNLDPNGTSFWSADFTTANVYKFNIATGAVELTFNTGTGAQTVFGLAIKGELTVANTPGGRLSDQKAGSVLVYPYYTSNAQTKADTRVTLTNLAGTLNPLPANLPPSLAGGTIYVHVFFLNGANCTQADMYVCLTKGASITFNTSTQDPDITGYIIAVAVNEMGRPVSWNALIGNAFVSTPEVSGNYGAEAFGAKAAAGARTEAGTGDTARLNLDGAAYDRGADQFAVEVQSPATATGQTIVHASVDGNIATGGTAGVSQLNTGLVIRGDEKQGSFVGFLSGGCHSSGVIRLDRPRVPSGMAAFVPAGQIATLVYNTNISSVGVLLTPKANAWSGIRTLHKTRTKDSILTIPVFMPVC